MRIGVFIGERFEEIEALTAVDILRRAEYDVETVSVSHTHHVRGSHGVEIKCDLCISEVSISSYDVLVLPGGPGHPNLEKCDSLMKHVKRFPGEGKFVAAICASPSILGRAGVLEGLKATCFPGFEKELKGATCTGAPAEWDGQVITGRSAGTAVDFALKIIEALDGPEAARKMADSIHFDHYEG
ncbi:MAG: DJ-1/PfpI family protein [Lachnospiraceae bacterium]|nr:DJ-1/PfpI family protein [Lachnospiraceae bacterium]